nr:MAG TPA: minor structural protein [Caudoviricetes sp.]
MALTRKLLKGMGLTDEQVDTIIEAHTDTVDGLKADVTRYKADAEKLSGVQKQLDDLKAAGDGGYKEKYEKEHAAFEAFKTDITAKESKAAKEKAVRAYFESKNITGANLDLAMRGCGEEMSALELDGEKIKDTKSLDALVDGTYKSLVSKPAVRLDMGARLNEGGKPMTKDEIMKITDRTERRAAIAANMDLFRKEE